MTHVTGLGDLLWLVQDPQFSILLILYNMTKNSQIFIEIMDGPIIFMGVCHEHNKMVYRKIRYPFITFDRKEMERCYKRVKDSS